MANPIVAQAIANAKKMTKGKRKSRSKPKGKRPAIPIDAIGKMRE